MIVNPSKLDFGFGMEFGLGLGSGSLFESEGYHS